MSKFEVCIRGMNFLIKTNNKAKKNSFYAARFVEANDASTAVEMAMDSFRSDLKGVLLNKKSDPPVLKVVEVEEVYYFQDTTVVGGITLPGKGFVWDEEVKEEVKRPISAWKGGWSGFRKSIEEKDNHIHTIFIHFTNALYPVAIFFMFLFLLFGKAAFHQTYFYLMLLATFSVPFSYLTGLFEWKRKHQQAMIPIFLAKIRYGIVVFIVGGLCTLWIYLYPGILDEAGIMSVIFILLNLSILPPLIYLGHLGGIIVYEGVD